MTTTIRRSVLGMVLTGLVLAPHEAAAQLDPLLYLKRTKPTVLIAVDTANRMQRDTNGDYRDDNLYVRLGGLANPWEDALGITDANTDLGRTYRRKYVRLINTDTSGSGDRFAADHIEIVGNRQSEYQSVAVNTGVSTVSVSQFDLATRIWIAKRGLLEAINRNANVVRFGLLRTRQSFPRYLTPAPSGATKWSINEGPVNISNGAWLDQQLNGDVSANRWQITRPVVSGKNGSIGGPVGPLVAADSNVNPTVVAQSVINILGLPTGANLSLVPAGEDAFGVVDAPVDNMLDDLKAEAARMIASDPECRNTVAILVVGGGEGNTSSENPVAKAAQFLNISGRRVPIHVIGIAPFSDDERDQLEDIASVSGGQFTEITAEMVRRTPAGQPVPEFVNAVNFAVSHTFVDQGDFDKAPDGSHPYGYETSHQVTSPIVGTVDLTNAVDIDGAPLPDTVVNHILTGEVIPQRSNLIITTGFSLPGFTAKMQAARVYRPAVDSSKSVGYKFVADGTKLWVASTPGEDSRNIFTALQDGTVVAFTEDNWATLRPYLRTADETATRVLIDFIRSQPLGAIVDSTPAIMDPPSLDPPPDADYPGFANTNKNRRGIIWVGANDGMLHGIDARLGKEVWAFVPFNLLPKLSALRSGQPVGDFRYYVDGSPKVADVKVSGEWRTYLVMGEGPGGTFYQTFDVTLPAIASTVAPDSDDLTQVLSYFSSPSSVALKWAFPQYQHFDWTLNQVMLNPLGALQAWPWGDVSKTAATALEKTVGETWSDPAVGQIASEKSPFVVLTGSGFFRWSQQQQPNRGVVAGPTFYLLDVATGDVLDFKDVGNDAKGEQGENCAAAAVNDCRVLKNALQADPVATGPSDSRYITKAYLGDLDGQIWRFDVNLDGGGKPVIQQMLKLYTISTGPGSKASDHPVFASMATVSIGYSQQYLFVGTGSDLLPRTVINTQYALLVILDQGASGLQTANIKLEATDGVAGDEKVSSFPAVAGDIVFFSTTTYKALACSKPDANLYAFTFIGGPAYDTNSDGKLSNLDKPKVRTTTGTRATAPFIVDQHLAFGTGNSVELFGDPEDFNNGVGQAGVRILSWREVR
jgi:hypothetical protein